MLPVDTVKLEPATCVSGRPDLPACATSPETGDSPGTRICRRAKAPAEIGTGDEWLTANGTPPAEPEEVRIQPGVVLRVISWMLVINWPLVGDTPLTSGLVTKGSLEAMT